jgi:hypothetical protein
MKINVGLVSLEESGLALIWHRKRFQTLKIFPRHVVALIFIRVQSVAKLKLSVFEHRTAVTGSGIAKKPHFLPVFDGFGLFWPSGFRGNGSGLCGRRRDFAGEAQDFAGGIQHFAGRGQDFAGTVQDFAGRA